MKKLSLAYFGTPDLSAYLLEKILKDKSLPVKVNLVITQPDRPVGKRQIVTASPVKVLANKHEIKTSSGQVSLKNIDLALVCAYGEIIPKELLSQAKFGFWNVHYSLLPKLRGATPVAYSLIAGDKITGVTLIQMDEKIDRGPIIAQEEMKILPNERRPDLEIRLTDLAFDMLKRIFSENVAFFRLGMSSEAGGPQWRKKRHIELKIQNHEKATYCYRLKKDDGFIPLSSLKKALANQPYKLTFKQFNNVTVYNLFRGLYPWPGVWTQFTPSRCQEGQYKRLKLTDLTLLKDKLVIKKVQLEGKKEVDFATFNRAYRIF